jgi:hypothetical protein
LRKKRKGNIWLTMATTTARSHQLGKRLISVLVVCILTLSTHSTHLEDVTFPAESNLMFNISQLSITSIANLVVGDGLGKGIVLASSRQKLYIISKNQDDDQLNSILVESIVSKRAPLLGAFGSADLNNDGWGDIAYASQGGGELMGLIRSGGNDDDVTSYVFDTAIALSIVVRGSE